MQVKYIIEREGEDRGKTKKIIGAQGKCPKRINISKLLEKKSI